MTGLLEFEFEWVDMPTNTHTHQFLEAFRSASGKSLRKLRLSSPISKCKEFFGTSNNFPYLEDLDLTFEFEWKSTTDSDGVSTDPPNTEETELFTTVAPFINQHCSTLYRINITSTSCTDLAAFFTSLCEMSSLRHLFLSLHFSPMTLSDPTGLENFVEKHANNLHSFVVPHRWGCPKKLASIVRSVTQAHIRTKIPYQTQF
ncbi:hypothetical protein CPB83DRAFT_850363 [Crepidotus variabilis]|uniref:Uncharacterized protein n=1 Tax=Crepidotus variabilis TaxID=179855 RepID=A0A9P6EKN0_9AGAR|nr:hypothetical protein CPB83DRAFT_850363 [Crepidotus variabilis]